MSGPPPINGGRIVPGAQSLRIRAGLQTRNPARGTFTFPSEIKLYDAKCTICQEEFNTGRKPEIPIALPGCGHVFGSVCISQWLHTPERNHGCPLCRRKPFERLRENVADEAGADERNSGNDEGNQGDEEEDAATPMTPIDAPFLVAELEDVIQGWEPFQVDQQSVDALQGSVPTGESQQYSPDNVSGPLVEVESRTREESTAAVLRYFLGDYPSTETVIRATRGRNIQSYEIAIEDAVHDHRNSFIDNPDERPPSYAEKTRLAYGSVQTAIRLAARWLRDHPPHNDMELRVLYLVLESSLRSKAEDFRNYDMVKLTDLIKAGILSSPRMQESFDDRMRMSQYVPGDIASLRNIDDRPRPYLARWARAMPRIAEAVHEIVEMETFMPLRIFDIDCERLWNEDMEAITPADLPIQTPTAMESILEALPDLPIQIPTTFESTIEALPAPPTDPILPPVGVSEANGIRELIRSDD